MEPMGREGPVVRIGGAPVWLLRLILFLWVCLGCGKLLGVEESHMGAMETQGAMAEFHGCTFRFQPNLVSSCIKTLFAPIYTLSARNLFA